MRVGKDYTFSLRRIGLKKAWTVYRFILSKSVYEPKDINVRDVSIANLLFLRFIESDVENLDWYLLKLGSILKSTCRLKMLNLEFQNGKIQKMAEHRWKLFEKHHHDFDNPLSPRAFLGLKKDPRFQHLLNNRILVHKNRKILDQISLPPKRFVGVGYQDSGSARNKSLDGSPSWQEIAMSGSSEYKRSKKFVQILEKISRKLDLPVSESGSRKLSELSLSLQKRTPRMHAHLETLLDRADRFYNRIDESDKVAVLKQKGDGK